MIHLKPEALVRALSVFMDTIGVKSAGGRTMLGVEIVNGLFLLVGLALVLGDELIKFLVDAVRGVPHISHTGKHYQLFAIIIGGSLLLVFVREMILPSKDRRAR